MPGDGLSSTVFYANLLAGHNLLCRFDTAVRFDDGLDFERSMFAGCCMGAASDEFACLIKASPIGSRRLGLVAPSSCYTRKMSQTFHAGFVATEPSMSSHHIDRCGICPWQCNSKSVCRFARPERSWTSSGTFENSASDAGRLRLMAVQWSCLRSEHRSQAVLDSDHALELSMHCSNGELNWQ